MEIVKLVIVYGVPDVHEHGQLAMLMLQSYLPNFDILTIVEHMISGGKMGLVLDLLEQTKQGRKYRFYFECRSVACVIS